MECSDTFTHTKTLPSWIDLNLCAPMTTWQLKDLLNKTDVIESCSRERVNTKWRFYRFPNLSVLLLYSKTYLWGAGTQFYPNLY